MKLSGSNNIVHRVFSARGLALRALVLAAVFIVMHLLGLRRFTGFLCGTLETGAGTREIAALLGLLYVIMYLAATIIVPVLIISASLLYLWEHFARQSFSIEGQRASPNDNKADYGMVQ